MQKQQGAEDKQAVRDSLNTATVASAVEGCEDPCSNRPINLPPPHQYQLERASGPRMPHHATPAISSNAPQLRRPELVSNSPNLHNSSDGLTWDHRLPQQLQRLRGELQTGPGQEFPSGRFTLSLYEQRQTIGSISRRPERDSRETRSANQSDPPTIAAAEATFLTHSSSRHFSAFLFSGAVQLFSPPLTGPSPVRRASHFHASKMIWLENWTVVAQRPSKSAASAQLCKEIKVCSLQSFAQQPLTV